MNVIDVPRAAWSLNGKNGGNGRLIIGQNLARAESGGCLASYRGFLRSFERFGVALSAKR